MTYIARVKENARGRTERDPVEAQNSGSVSKSAVIGSTEGGEAPKGLQKQNK